MKRFFDFTASLILLLFFFIPIIILVIIAKRDTKGKGIYTQKRVGKKSKLFVIYKIETINRKTKTISKFGRFLRNKKLDEFPQLINILKGEMSFVGPRPELVGYTDRLKGEYENILNLRPGLTGLASLKYIDEENILLKQLNPIKYNDEVIFPDKLKINLHYYNNQSFCGDLQILYKTLIEILTK